MKPFSWIKLSTDFFEDPKILRLQTYPEKDFLLIFWIKIVILSLRRNDGLLLIDDELPYSVSDFVSMFKKDESVIRMALSIFEKLNMIAVKTSGVGEIIGLREFVGFTDVEELEDSRRKNREKQAAFRKRQKAALLEIESSKNEELDDEYDESEEVTGYSPVSNQKVTGQNRREEIRKEENRVEEEKDFAPSDFSKSGKSSKPESGPLPPDDHSFETPRRSAISPPHQRIQMDRQTIRWKGILPEDINRWKESFPVVDVEQELRVMEVWVSANRAKWKSNWLRFIVSWLSREQDRGGSSRSRGAPGQTPHTFEQIKAERTHAAANQVLDEIYGPKETEVEGGTISI